MKLLRLFHIKRNEYWPTLVFFIYQLALQIIVIARYFNVFSTYTGKDYRNTVLNTFHISGFDPLTYLVVSRWTPEYDLTRHPLLHYFYYPIYLINKGLMAITGIDFGPILVAIILLFCAVYSFIFMLRIGKEIIQLSNKEAIVISFMLFSFAYIMLAAISPDHFILSLFMLMLTLYISGKHIKEKKRMGIGKTILLFFFTAGISLNNGLKVFLANFFCNKRSFFRPLNLFLAIIIPGIMLFYAGRWEDQHYKEPQRVANRAKKAKKMVKEKKAMYAKFKDTTAIKSSQQREIAFNSLWKQHLTQEQKKHDSKPVFAHQGKHLKNFPLHSWTDISTPRIPSIVENFFGQGLQLHQKNTLDDVLRDRPVIVTYNWVLNYCIEGLIVLLFACGIVVGWRHRFLWLALSCFAIDALLFLGLGFGINEVYIMTSGWAYVIPISIGYLIAALRGKARFIATALASLLTLYLLVYNTTLFLINFL